MSKQALDKRSEPSELSQRITPKVESFIKYFAKSGNITQSAMQAGFSPHNPNSARVTGSRLLRNPLVIERIQLEREWEFDSWCKQVKGIFHNNNAWQAQLKALELYARAKNWLRETSGADVAIGLLDKLAGVIKAYNNSSNSLTNSPLTKNIECQAKLIDSQGEAAPPPAGALSKGNEAP